jgi:peptidoglycan/xylan/chitin deacetylase (PgdA/CDA1 family)
MAIVRAHPELFEVGNHTRNHCNLVAGGGGAACPATRPDDAFVTQELVDAAAAITAAAGQSPAPYWRPPYGAQDLRLRTVAAAAGYPTTVMWTLDTIDWRTVADGGPTALDIAKKLRGLPAGGIALMHLGGWNTLDGLPYGLAGLRSRSLSATSISGLLD